MVDRRDVLGFHLSIVAKTNSAFTVHSGFGNKKENITSYRIRTMVQNNQESRLQYRATRSSIRSFACTAHSFTCSALLTLSCSLCPACFICALHCAHLFACLLMRTRIIRGPSIRLFLTIVPPWHREDEKDALWETSPIGQRCVL